MCCDFTASILPILLKPHDKEDSTCICLPTSPQLQVIRQAVDFHCSVSVMSPGLPLDLTQRCPKLFQGQMKLHQAGHKGGNCCSFLVQPNTADCSATSPPRMLSVQQPWQQHPDVSACSPTSWSPPASPRSRKEPRASNRSKVIYKELLHSVVQNDT